MDPQIAYLVLLLAALLVWNWRFIGLDRLTGFGGPRSVCRWRKVAEASADAPAHWACDRCGKHAGTRDGKRPTRCLERNAP